MTTQEKVGLLRKDILRRESENYTSASRDGRLGWEKLLSDRDAYSSILVAPKDDTEIADVIMKNLAETDRKDFFTQSAQLHIDCYASFLWVYGAGAAARSRTSWR